MDIFFGSQAIPPFEPPYGKPPTAHFQVIHIDNAVTSSKVTFGWYLKPPLNGPNTSQCCTRQPSKTPMLWSSIFIVTETKIDLFGRFKISYKPLFRFSFSAAILSCAHATVKGVCS